MADTLSHLLSQAGQTQLHRVASRTLVLWGPSHLALCSIATELSFLPDFLPPGCELQGDLSQKRSVHLPETFLYVQQNPGRVGWVQTAQCQACTMKGTSCPPPLCCSSLPYHRTTSEHTGKKDPKKNLKFFSSVLHYESLHPFPNPGHSSHISNPHIILGISFGGTDVLTPCLQCCELTHALCGM